MSFKHRGIRTCAALLLLSLLAACQGNGAASRTGLPPATSTTSHETQPSHSSAQELSAPCPADHPTPLTAGTYQLGQGSVLPGLELTLPAGWSCTENSTGQFSVMPPGQSTGSVVFWEDMVAVKSTGPGHGATVLHNVGTTPTALLAWLTSDKDFLIVSKPTPVTIGQGIKMTSVVVGVSHTANYGDPTCPSNPRCADLFVNPVTWGAGDWYSIGGDEQLALDLGPIHAGGNPHSLLIALDAADHTSLTRLQQAATPILRSLTLPAGAVAG
jgi:hypothetical protein